MADKQITFSINIEGNEKILKNLTEAEKAVKQLNKELKETDKEEVYKLKEQELIKAKAALNAFRKEQKQQVKDFEATKLAVGSYEQLQLQIKESTKAYKQLSEEQRKGAEGQALRKSIIENKAALKELNNELTEQKKQVEFAAGSYDELNSKLVKARRAFKELSQEDREGAIGQELQKTIQGLDTELKDLDKTIGQNQRSVGNYTESFNEALGSIGGQFGDVIQGFKGIGQAASNAGNLISKAFVAFQAVQLIIEAVGAVDEFVDATREAQRQVELTFGTIGAETDKLVVKVKALSETFNVDLDQSLKATNALVQQFGIDAEEATDLLADGLASAADQSEFLGRATDDLGKLSSAGIDASQAIGLIAETTNKGINVDVLSEGIISLRENAQGTADAIENAFGEEKAAQIAEAFKNEPIEALKIVAAEQKKLDQNSKESAELIANVFKGVGEENIKSVQAIADLNGNLDELKENAGESAERFDALRAANEDFAAAQVEVSNSLKGAVGNTEAFTTNVKTGLLVVLQELIKAVQPAIDLFKEFFGGLSEGGSVIDKVKVAASFLGDVIKVLLTFVVELIKFQVNLAQSFAELLNKIPFVSEAISQLSAGFKNFTSVVAGVRAAITQVAKNISITFKDILLGLKIFAKQAEEIVSFGEADARVKKQLEDLRNQREQLNAERLSAIDAFKKGFEENKREELDAQIAAELEAKNEAVKAVKEQQAAVATEKAKGDAEARKKAEEEEKKRLEDLKKAQDAFTQEQIKIATERAALLLDVAKRIRDNEIGLLEDSAAARRATIEAQYADELEAIQQQENELIRQQEEREAQALELFAENSQEVIALRAQQAQDLQALQAQTAILETQALEKRNNEVVDLEKDLVKEQQAVRQIALNDTIANIDFSTSLQLEKLKQLYAQGEISQEDFNTRSASLEQERLQDVIASYETQIAELEALRASGVAIDEKYYDSLILNSNKAKTQLEQNAKDIAAGQTVIGEELAKTIEQVGSVIQQGIGQIDQLFANINAKELERVEARRAAQEQELEELQGRLSQASGLQRVALQQRVDAEIKEQKRLEKEQEAIEKREAARQKRFAIAQALINGALAITNILATVPKFDFGVATALQVGAAIASTAAQVAVISSQQFAKGGILDGASHAQGGIKTPYGELEGGEAVINKRSTAKFKPLLSRINEAGGGRKFAAGGVLTAPIVAPTSAESELNQFTAALAGNISAISQRVDNIKVTLNTDEEQREEQDRQENINIATLTTDSL